MAEAMLTTIDNPFDPFDDYERWSSYDTTHGYNTEGLIARLCDTAPNLPPAIMQDDYDDAIERVLKIDFCGVYKKVIKEGGSGSDITPPAS